MTEDVKVSRLKELLNECLESFNQEHSFDIIEFDDERKKLTVEFNVVEVPEDDYIGFAGY